MANSTTQQRRSTSAMKRTLAAASPKRMAGSVKHVKNNKNVSMVKPLSKKGNAAFTGIGAAVDYSDSRQKGLNKKQATSVAAADAPITAATIYAGTKMKSKHHFEARKAGLASLHKAHPDAAPLPQHLPRKSPELKSYSKGAKPILRKGFARRAGLYGAGIVASSAAVTGLQHHFAVKNVRATNKHPNSR